LPEQILAMPNAYTIIIELKKLKQVVKTSNCTSTVAEDLNKQVKL